MADSTLKNVYFEKVNYEVLSPPLTTGTTLGLFTRGDLLTHNGSNATRLGSNRQDGNVLSILDSDAVGLRWIPITGFASSAEGHLYSRNYRSGASQSIPNNASTNVTFTTSLGASVSPVTQTGMYLVSFGGAYASTAAQVSFTLAVDGIDVTVGVQKTGFTGVVTIGGLRYVPVTSGQTISVRAFQNSGAALNVTEAWLDCLFIGLQ